jgi:hypothetical protein
VLETITVPCGAWVAARHRPTLAAVKAGAPAWVTLVDGADHCTVTQGLGIGGVPGKVNGQPAIMNVSLTVSTGASMTAFVALGVAVTVPPCGHIIALAAVRRGGLIA